jgi:hypothetical protein
LQLNRSAKRKPAAANAVVASVAPYGASSVAITRRTRLIFVHWTVGHVFDNGATIDVVIGRWGDGTSATDRYAVRIDYRIFDHGPELMVRDAQRHYVKADLAAHCLKRSDVVGGPLAAQVFAICDAFLAHDSRLAALWDRPTGN